MAEVPSTEATSSSGVHKTTSRRGLGSANSSLDLMRHLSVEPILFCWLKVDCGLLHHFILIRLDFSEPFALCANNFVIQISS